MRTRLSTFVASMLAWTFLSAVASAQVADTTAGISPLIELDPIVVTARKVESTLASSTVGVSVMDARLLRALPQQNAASFLGYLPGMTFLDFDGLGYAPQAVTRGFYGGGEAEYVIVMLNGKPVNNLENGLVNWEQIVADPSTVVEVVRGGASSLYGDAAIGAVLNVRTTPAAAATTTLRAALGGYGLRTVAGSTSNRRYSALGELNTSTGYRDHSDRTTGTFQGSYLLVDRSAGSLTATTTVNVRDYETPGPLRSSDLAATRTGSLPFFRFDRANEKTFRASLDGHWRLAAGRLDASMTGESRDVDMTRTLPLSPDFADTQERQVDATGFRTHVQISNLTLPLPLDNEVVIGLDGHVGSMDSRYFHVATGGIPDTYETASGARGELQSDGSAERTGLAGYVHLELHPTDRLRLSVGGRLDHIRDSFDGAEGSSEAATATTHTEFSPKLGANLRYLSSATQVGNLYASISRSFKAPTLDQLYDLRAFPVPFPPFAIRISNAGLIPQLGTNFEVGFYHRVLDPNGWSAAVSGSAYSIDMENEIDFSFETFSNVSIGKSRHRGLESSLSLGKNAVGQVFLNYTLQNVTFMKGENLGNRVKAIPLHALSAGVVAEFGAVSSSIAVRGIRDVFVDDANTVRLPDYATVDARISYTKNAVRLTFDVRNLLDKQFDSTAYPDPAGSQVLFVFPGALRTATFGVELTL